MSDRDEPRSPNNAFSSPPAVNDDVIDAGYH